VVEEKLLGSSINRLKYLLNSSIFIVQARVVHFHILLDSFDFFPVNLLLVRNHQAEIIELQVGPKIDENLGPRFDESLGPKLGSYKHIVYLK